MFANFASGRGVLLACGAALTLLAGGAAHAQMASNSASFNAGWGRMPGQENRGPDTNTRDANGNRVIIDGIIMGGSDQSFFSRGAASSFAGVGASAGGGGATAIGNSLTVITQGSYNVVIVDSTQINEGDVTANASGGSDDHGS